MPVYVLDTNLFIQAHRVSYPLDVVTSFWKKINVLAEREQIISVDKVKDEIDRNEDELKRWIDANLPPHFFKETKSEDIIEKYAHLAPWAESKADHYQRGAIDEFLEFKNADAWLVAYCMVTGDMLVTQEVSNPDQKNKIPLPQVCIEFNVQYCNMIEMFRNIQEQF